MFAIHEIMKHVPHRYPFLLIDRVLEFSKDQSITTLKNVSINESQFQGHFPGRPIFPGVYIIEHIAQSACFLLVKSAGGIETGMIYYLGTIKRMTFLKPVYPGDQLISKVTVERKWGFSALVAAVSTVEDIAVAKGELMFGAVRAGAEA